MGALENALLLKCVVQALLVSRLYGLRALMFTHLLLVCKAWRDAYDEVVKKELKELDLCSELRLPLGRPSLHPSSILRSALFKGLAGVQRAHLELVCRWEGVGAQVDLISTVSLHAGLLHFMPALQSLHLGLVGGMAAHLDRLLPRLGLLTQLELSMLDGEQEHQLVGFSALQPALVAGLLHLPNLEDLGLTSFPAGSFTIQALAAAASRHLTSLDVHTDADAELEDFFPLQHLGGLSCFTSLQHVSISGCLYGPQEVPAALSGLTHLDLPHNCLQSVETGPLALSVGAATALRSLSLQFSLLQAWPEGLDQLSRLTHLDLRTAAPLLHLPDDPPLLLPRQLRFLAVGRQTFDWQTDAWGTFQQALPALTHLTALQRLECSYCQPQQVLAGLPHWERLSCLELVGCDLAGEAAVGGMLEHRHIYESLRELRLRECSLQCVPPGLESCTLLTRLDISSNPGLSNEFLKLGRLVSLQMVNIAGCQLAQPPLGLAQLSRLHWLDLSGNCFVAASIQPLSLWLEGHFGRKVGSGEICRSWP